MHMHTNGLLKQVYKNYTQQKLTVNFDHIGYIYLFFFLFL